MQVTQRGVRHHQFHCHQQRKLHQAMCVFLFFHFDISPLLPFRLSADTA